MIQLVGNRRMKGPGAPRARRVPVAAEEQLGGGDRHDYADAFEIRLREPDARTAEEFVRFALEEASRLVRWIIWIAHRYLIRFRLAPRLSKDHILGWESLRSEPDVVVLQAMSPFLRGVIVGRKVDPTRAVITTYVFYTRPAVCRVLLKIIGPVHRRIAPYLLERAAASANGVEPQAVPAGGDA